MELRITERFVRKVKDAHLKFMANVDAILKLTDKQKEDPVVKLIDGVNQCTGNLVGALNTFIDDHKKD